MKYINVLEKDYLELKKKAKLLDDFEKFVVHRKMFFGKNISIKVIQEQLQIGEGNMCYIAGPKRDLTNYKD